MKKKKKRFVKLKKALAGFMALVLVVGLTILGTLAYLSTKSNEVTNVFTATGNIKLNLIEPSFDPEEASKFKPSGVYPKDPTLVNTTGDDSSEWVILRVDYMISKDENTPYSNVSKGDITYKNSTDTPLSADNAKGLIQISNLPGDNWIKLDLNDSWLTNASKVEQAGDVSPTGKNAICEFYVYKKALESGSAVKNQTVAQLTAMSSIDSAFKTTPLFTGITIQSQDELVMNGYNMDTLPRFKIDIVGGAIKNEGKEDDVNNDSYIASGQLDITSGAANETISKTIVNNLLGLVADKTPSTAANSTSSLGS